MASTVTPLPRSNSHGGATLHRSLERCLCEHPAPLPEKEEGPGQWLGAAEVQLLAQRPCFIPFSNVFSPLLGQEKTALPRLLGTCLHLFCVCCCNKIPETLFFFLKKTLLSSQLGDPGAWHQHQLPGKNSGQRRYTQYGGHKVRGSKRMG